MERVATDTSLEAWMLHVPTREAAASRRVPSGDFLAPDELRRLAPQEVARRTAALAPLAAECATEAERLRRPVAEVWAAIRASGLFYSFVPRSFGGLGGDTDAFVDAALPIARACPATAWSACFCAGHNRTLAHFPAKTQAELWGGDYPYIVAPNLGAPPGKAVPVPGGYRVTGRWGWASGIMDADWVFAATLIAQEEAQPQMAFVLVPAEECEVVDTWHVDGLAGSGSNDVEMTDVFVPERRTVTDMNLLSGKTEPARRHPEPIFRAPLVSFAGFVASIPVLGAAQGALDLFREGLLQRVEKGTNTKGIDNPLKHARLAQADLMIGAAEMLIRDGGRQTVAAAALDGPNQIRLRIQIRARLAYAVKLCRDAALHLAEGAGSGVHRLERPFQRHLRDIAMMASHVGFDADQSNELHGRSLLDLEPRSMIF